MSSSQHIVRSYDEELTRISNRIVEMGGRVEAQLADAIEAVSKRNSELAQRAIDMDAHVDEMETEIDDLTVKLLARRQPMADDLREMVAALRIVGMLERVGDYAVHVAERAVSLSNMPVVPPVLVISRMGKMVRDLFGDAVGAYAHRDAELALSVWRRDRDLDQLYASLFRELLTYMMEDSQNVTTCVHLLFVAKYIERMGDFSTNIAEHVHYIVRGHKPEGQRPKAGSARIATE